MNTIQAAVSMYAPDQPSTYHTLPLSFLPSVCYSVQSFTQVWQNNFGQLEESVPCQLRDVRIKFDEQVNKHQSLYLIKHYYPVDLWFLYAKLCNFNIVLAKFITKIGDP